MAQKKQKTPAQAARSKLSEAIRARGERGSNIWLVRPPFESRDLILNSDPQCEAFYLLEGESTFRHIVYLPQWYEVQETSAGAHCSKDFAVVTTTDGNELPVRLVFGSEPSKDTPITLTPFNGAFHINLRVLDSYLQRTENWRRVIPCIRRVQPHPTEGVQRELAMMVHQARRLTLGELAARMSVHNPGILYGAVATLLRKRVLHSDLDSRAWSTKTVVWVRDP